MNVNPESKGTFVISLDFELWWGVWDVTTREKYGENITGVKEAMPLLLEVFKKHGIKATFATVGFLFARDKEELLATSPLLQPSYSNAAYDVYKNEIPLVGENEKDDPYHYGFSLLDMIKNSPHETGTHTFSHYYCMEPGQTAAAFNADLEAAIAVGKKNNISIKSLVFPRNQFNKNYLDILQKNGIVAYRGNPGSWVYKPRPFSEETIFIRLYRLLDTYLPLSGYNTYRINKQGGVPINIPASRFLKPYNKTLSWLEKMKLKRIMNEMTKAAQRGELYHLWWHPHNFGVNIEENMEGLDTLLNHFQKLNKQYGFVNMTMKEVAGTN